MRNISRHGALSVFLAVAVGLAGAGAIPANAETIRVMTWGGLWLDIFRPIAADFEKKTGNKVEFVVQSGAADGMTKLAAQRANPQVDVWTSIESTVQSATKEGLLAPLDPKKIPNLQELPASLKTETSAAIWLSPRGIFYRKDLVPFEITKWQDLWDPRLKGKVGVTFELDRGSFVIMAALLNGGSEKNIGPGFEKVKELKDNIHAVYKTDPESIKLLETGEISVAGWGILPNVYRRLGPDSQYRFVMPAPRFLATIPVSIVKGRSPEQLAAAEAFVNQMLAPESQTVMASIAGTIPANPKAAVPDKLKTVLPALPVPDVYNVDWSEVDKHYAEWQDTWAREIQTR
jgi:putative spermidine/putrescine transport system substrate-binding protein